MEIKNENKKSKLVFDMKLVRKLLKMNEEVKFCPYCGTRIEDNCDCHKNIIVDVKPYRNEYGDFEIDRSVMVFQNNEAFQNDLTQLIDEIKAKKEAESEQIVMDLD
jgi:formate dehydrogenase maturation protein FdhE